MKVTRNIFTQLSVLVAILVSGCNKNLDDPIWDTDPGNSSQPGRVQALTVDATDAYAISNGAKYVYGSCNFVLVLSRGTYGSDNDFKGEGVEIALDLNGLASDASKRVTPGTYNFSTNENRLLALLPGFDSEGYTYPSYVYRKYANGTSETTKVSGGDVTVSYDRAGKVDVRGTVHTGAISYKFSYYGDVPIYDGTDAGGDNGGNVGGDTPSEGGKIRAYCNYYGDYYGNGTDDYVLTMYVGEYAKDAAGNLSYDFVGEGEELRLEILTPKKGGNMTIPVGEYTYAFEEKDMKAFTVLGGYVDDDGFTQPSYYYHTRGGDDYDLAIVNACNMYVNKSGEPSSIKVYFTAGEGTNAKKMCWLFEGNIEFIDDRESIGSSSQMAATKSGIRPARNISRDLELRSKVHRSIPRR